MTCFEFLSCIIAKIREKTGTEEIFTVRGGNEYQFPHIVRGGRGSTNDVFTIFRTEPETINFKMRKSDLELIGTGPYVKNLIRLEHYMGGPVRGIYPGKTIQWEEVADYFADFIISYHNIPKNSLNALVQALKEDEHGI